ncbi:MAG: 3-deoxy-D-manno-octulosonic acid transferase [Planctomycetota bacterium]|jgi:3-deoxy-D-manno-octulosonic-acid transferase
MRKWLFNFAYLSVALVIWPWFVIKALTTGKYRAGLGQRLGFLPKRDSKRKSIWLHAVSVGELLQSRPLIEALKLEYPDHDIVLTYTTKTAASIAAKDFADLYHVYSPIDLSWVVAKFFRVLKPDLLVLVELELWPNWLMHARKTKVPVLLANGRVSENSFGNYRRFKWLLQPAYDAISIWAMQDEAYAERAQVLKSESSHCVVTGNLKYDSLRESVDETRLAEFRKLFAIADVDPVVLFGSTHPGEHEVIVEMLPLDARVIVWPRHPERVTALCDLLKDQGLAFSKRSVLSVENPAEGKHIIVGDTVGELSDVYGLASVVFVGGSLIPHGGQNMAEPIALGKPTIVGPNTGNFRATMRDLREVDGVIEVQNPEELAEALKRVLAGKTGGTDNGQRRLLAGKGALKSHLEQIRTILSSTSE